MLAFDQQFIGIDAAFQDSDDPSLVHVLPDTLQPTLRDDKSELSLALHATQDGTGGGLFQARFLTSRAAHADLSDRTWQLAGIQSCRSKLTPRSQVAQPDNFGIWHAGVVDGQGGLLLNFFLNAQNGQLMRHLALEGGRALDLSIEMGFLGQVSGFSFLASLSGESLHDQLSAVLGSGAFSATEFTAAMLSVSEDQIVLTRDGEGNDPGRETLLRETAQRALPLLSERTGPEPLFELRPRDRFEAFALPLDSPRRELRTHRLDWSLSQFVEALSADQQLDHFPLMRSIEPFSQVDIQALNHIPLATTQAMSARLDLRFTGRTGTQETATLEFRPDDGPLKSLATVYPSLTHEFELESRLRLMLAPPGGRGFPRFWPKSPQFVPSIDPFSIDISAELADVALVQVKALDGLFDHCSRILATIVHDGGNTTAEVSMESPDVWAILPGHPNGKSYSLKLEALAPNADLSTPYVLHDGPHDEPLVTISALDVTVRRATPVRCEITGEFVRFAVLEIRATENTHTATHVLRPGDQIDIPVWRPSVFEPLSYEWRVAAIRDDGAGQTLPIAQGEWQQTDQQTLQIS